MIIDVLVILWFLFLFILCGIDKYNDKVRKISLILLVVLFVIRICFFKKKKRKMNVCYGLNVYF